MATRSAGSKATAVFGSAWFGVFSVVMTLLILRTYPWTRVSERRTQLIARGQKVHVSSREESIAMTDVGQKSGRIDGRQSKIIRNLFRFEALTARDIMTRAR